ncbi:GNAT family N-acetyltransferase [Streptomyces sp. MUM 203J]|uniref:GNAT family N-acetyltransferase n=1 Tax=Streptomyces sp. MUM 203J TaxID=2791990 RepID=UPI001F0486B4|nr:GNAT family N-acetyltransferase [Streptomyces sp. MUM 203J]MCH0538568.1 GNAT family N-acetyltransferase [Streptomyces sp. MUM 203J]
MTSPAASGVVVRHVTEDDFPDWLLAHKVGFLRPPVVTDEEVALRRKVLDPERTRGAFDGARCVGTFLSFAQELTAVGGTAVPAGAVTGVTVSPTHRRRGVLSRMMNAELAEAKERGDVVSTLCPTEYPIYGRYGFGPAAWTTVWDVDVTRAGLDPRWSGPEDGGRVDLVDGAAIRETAPAVHDRVRAVRHGVVSRSERVWQRDTGVDLAPGEPWTEPFYVVYRDASGEPAGHAAYTVERERDGGAQPIGTAGVRELMAATPAAERALWRYLCAIDRVTRVRSGRRAPDDLLPELLPDPRAARVVSHVDLLWVRVLDVVRALESRTYETAGSLVLEVRDRAGLAEGRFRLEASPEGAACGPTTETPELIVDVAELGALWLGESSVARLVVLGRAEETRAGAAARADLLLRAARRAWCPDVF